jgi:hypothetical protein
MSNLLLCYIPGERRGLAATLVLAGSLVVIVVLGLILLRSGG